MNAFSLLQSVEKYGMCNLYFKMVTCLPIFKIQNDDLMYFEKIHTNINECVFKITEKYYKIKNNYKLELIPVFCDDGIIFNNKNNLVERFYISDFEKLIDEGFINVYVQTNDGFEPLNVKYEINCTEEQKYSLVYNCKLFLNGVLDEIFQRCIDWRFKVGIHSWNSYDFYENRIGMDGKNPIK